MLTSCIMFWSLVNGINPDITTAIIAQESSFNSKAVGSIGEQGLMQIRPEFVRYTKLQLLSPCTNIMVGTSILKKVKDSCKMCADNVYVIGYNLGITGMNRIKHPHKFPYYIKVMNRMK